MKALQIIKYGEVRESVSFREIDKPKIKDNEVLIETYAAAVNPLDYKIVLGDLKQMLKLQIPATLGYDLSGIVVEKGSKVNNLKVGDEIYSRIPTESPGAFAEYVAVDSSVVVKKPNNLSFNEASSIPLVGLTSIQSLETANIKSGDKILIHAGSGGVGTFAIQYAKAKGAYVYTTTSTENVSWIKELGADVIIDYKKENYLTIVNDLDIVFDTLGGQYTLDAFKVIKNGGRVVSLAGEIDGDSARELGLNGIIRMLLALKRRKITKQIKSKSAHYKFIMMKPDASQLIEITSLIENELIKPVIDKEFPFSEGVDALVYQKSGRAKGKIVIKMK